MKPNENVPMTETAIEKAESSIFPMWPMNMVVTELVPNWQRIWNAIGPPIIHNFAVSLQKILHQSLIPFAGK